MSLLRLSPKNRNPLYCSFCGKEKDEVVYLVAGSTVFICNECVELCREIGAKTVERGHNDPTSYTGSYSPDAAQAPLNRETVAQILARFHRNACYPDAMDAELSACAESILALAQEARDLAAMNVLENLPNVTEAEGRAMATGEATLTQPPQETDR